MRRDLHKTAVGRSGPVSDRSLLAGLFGPAASGSFPSHFVPEQPGFDRLPLGRIFRFGPSLSGNIPSLRYCGFLSEILNFFTPICLSFRLSGSDRRLRRLPVRPGFVRFCTESPSHSAPEARKTHAKSAALRTLFVSGCLRQTTRHKRSPFRAGAGSTVPPPPASLPGAGRRNRRACART